MYALPVEFHRMRKWNFVAGEELLVAVARSTSVGQIFLGYRRGHIARDLNLMYGTVAGETIRRVLVARCRRFPVNALLEIFHFVGVALRTLYWSRLTCSHYFVRIAVAGLASAYADRTMDAPRHMGRFFAVTGRALHLGYFVRMGKILDGRVAVGAAQNAVDTGRMFGRIDRDTLASGRGYSCLAVAGETAFVLFEGLRCFRLCLNPHRNQNADGNKKKRDETAKF
jgi:hypothetical protein